MTTSNTKSRARRMPFELGPKLIAKLGVRLASLLHGSSAEGRLAISGPLRARCMSGIMATFLDSLIGTGCSDEMRWLRLM